MSERPDPQEGWDVPRRLPLLLATVTLVAVTVGLLLSGRLYMARIAPLTRAPVPHLPMPVLETGQIAPGERRTSHPLPPKGLDAAIGASAREGDALWQDRR